MLFAATAVAFAVFLIGLASYEAKPHLERAGFRKIKLPHVSWWRFDSEKDALNYGLTDDQCDAAFPGLFQEIDRAREHFKENKIQEKDVRIGAGEEEITNSRSEFHAMIYNGQLIVVNETKGEPDRSRGLAALASLHRAMNAIPNPRELPNIEFVLDLHDRGEAGSPDKVRWTWARHKTNQNMWVVPDFDGWSYPDDAVGSYPQFRDEVMEAEVPLDDKIPQLAWRGSLGVNGGLRKALVEASENQTWSDVKSIDWRTRNNVIPMQDFCKYKYVAHTEGNTWSGRLRYLHNCNSVPVIHELDWVAHYYPLLRREGARQNYIHVERDFSDLSSAMEDLEARPDFARAIAAESVSTFRDRYLTPAAEACYWRRLIHAWASVQAFEPRLYDYDGEVDVEVVQGETVRKGDGRRRRGMSWERYAFRTGHSNEHGFIEGGADECKAPKKEEEESKSSGLGLTSGLSHLLWGSSDDDKDTSSKDLDAKKESPKTQELKTEPQTPTPAVETPVTPTPSEAAKDTTKDAPNGKTAAPQWWWAA
ncbi:glycosyl transferase family 90-domain-containing protein [Phyllosticta capitalensis]|uniref:glycosyl transferase family 90-domain-containing protein n=1 Tax=Phyllosticta capitalensis TaxID=121624 RepID=UPI00312E5A3D